MKHLHKAFTKHRLVRTHKGNQTDDSVTDVISSSAPDELVTPSPSPAAPSDWQRTRPWPLMDNTATPDLPGLIALWDEIEETYI